MRFLEIKFLCVCVCLQYPWQRGWARCLWTPHQGQGLLFRSGGPPHWHCRPAAQRHCGARLVRVLVHPGTPRSPGRHGFHHPANPVPAHQRRSGQRVCQAQIRMPAPRRGGGAAVMIGITGVCFFKEKRTEQKTLPKRLLREDDVVRWVKVKSSSFRHFSRNECLIIASATLSQGTGRWLWGGEKKF